MTLMIIMTGSTTGDVLLQLARAPPQITPKENMVGIDTELSQKTQRLVFLPFLTRPLVRPGYVVQNQSCSDTSYKVGLENVKLD